MTPWAGESFKVFVGSFVVVHQALIELYKLVSRYKMRRYWEALAYVVYGPEMKPDEDREWRPARMDRVRGAFARLPSTLSPKVRSRWSEGSEDRLIQSFLLRAVGDNPVTDISDSDIKNVIEIARQAAEGEAGEVSRLLEDLVRSGTRSGTEIIATFERLHLTDPRVSEWVTQWIRGLADAQDISAALLVALQNQFDTTFVPGILRAKRELANALKAAEFQYHRNLHGASTVLAAVEGLVISCVLKLGGIDFLISAVVAFGLLLVLPRGSKSLTDAVIAIGSRMKR